jgi:hypothetical protein
MFCIVGLNEIATLIALACFSLFSINYFFKHKRINMYFVLIVFAIGISLSIMFLSPGNLRRNTLNPLNHNIHNTVFGSLQIFGERILFWFFIVTLSSFILSKYVNFSFVSNVKMKTLLILLLSSFLFPLLLYFPAYWGLGEAPPLRTENSIFFIFQISLTLIILVFNANSRIFSLKIFDKNYILLGCFFLIFGLVYFKGNLGLMYNDLKLDLPKKYLKENNERIDFIKNNKADLIVLEPLKSKPQCIYFDDLGDSTTHWINKAYSRVLDSKPIISKRN